MNLIEDLATLTTIPPATLRKLADKSVASIAYDVQENMLNCNNITSIDIGIGTLNILADDTQILYKFIPSKQLEKAVTDTVLDGKSPLTRQLESALREKVVNVYKDLF